MKRLLLNTLLLSALILLLFIMTGCVSYDKAMKKALKRAFPDEAPLFSFRSTPVGNFGVGTIYSGELITVVKDKKDIASSEMVLMLASPNTWYKIPADKPALDDVIFEEGSIGHVMLEEKISSRLDLNVVLPNISKILDAGMDISFEKGVDVSLKASSAVIRNLNWSEFSEAIESNKIKPYVGRLIREGNVIMGAKDIVLYGYTAEISINSEVNPDLHAKINQAVGNAIGADSEFELDIKKIHAGKFEVTATDPVIAAVLFVKPPPNILDRDNRDIALKALTRSGDFEIIIIKNSVLDPLEEILQEQN